MRDEKCCKCGASWTKSDVDIAKRVQGQLWKQGARGASKSKSELCQGAWPALSSKSIAPSSAKSLSAKDVWEQMLGWKKLGVKINGMPLEHLSEEFQEHYVQITPAEVPAEPKPDLCPAERAREIKKLLNAKLEEASRTRAKIVKAEADVKSMEKRLEEQRGNLVRLRSSWEASFNEAREQAASFNEALAAQLQAEVSDAGAADASMVDEAKEKDAENDSAASGTKRSKPDRVDGDVESQEEKRIWKGFQDSLETIIAKRQKSGEDEANDGAEALRGTLQTAMEAVMGSLQQPQWKGGGKGGDRRFEPYQQPVEGGKGNMSTPAVAEAEEVRLQIESEQAAGQALLATNSDGHGTTAPTSPCG